MLIADSVETTENYAKRAKELGHSILSSCEHGWQGRYVETYEVAKKYGLKFLFSTEAYWVKDRFDKDGTNCHIFLAAKNENGRRCLNDVLAEANITGRYIRPRLDIPLLLSLPPKDVWVTTACLAFWKYDDAEDIIQTLHDHFKENLYLEVQYHNTQQQRDLNRKILKISNRLNIPIIMGCDSHYINQLDAQSRTDFLESKEMRYGDEEGWYLDYPDGDEAYKRFATQCVLSHNEIMNAIENTNIFLEVEEYKCRIFDKTIKMPSLYKDLSQEERNQKFTDLVMEKLQEEKAEIPPELWDKYVSETQAEIRSITETNTSDYFLGNYVAIQEAKKNGGVITLSGRGSAVSHYSNKLLGFTDVDRIAAPVKMYPERFMSVVRILETGSIPDIDFNLANPLVFAEAFKTVWGSEHVFPLLAYGTMGVKSAFKMYAKSQKIDFSIANAISDQLTRFEKAYKAASEDEKDLIAVEDYVDEQYWQLYAQSETYQKIINSWSIHPCAYLIYDGDIRREIGLIKVKENLCCLMDGHWAEDYKFLKNDLLKVSVVELIDKVFKRIGKESMSITQLVAECPPESPVWSIYDKGCTLGVNQLEKPGTAKRAQKYKPRNISELCAFIAAIRPGFKSMYKTFESRQDFLYNVGSFDRLIQTKEMPYSFVLYQEQLMAALNFSGIDMGECYSIIKSIAKKRAEQVFKHKSQFSGGFEKVVMCNDHLTEEQADDVSQKIWQIIEDSAQYSFNASHAYCMAVDSLFCAYLKHYHPLEFYETLLSLWEAKGNKDKMNEIQMEAEEFFKIKFPPFRYEQDHRSIVMDAPKKAINMGLSSIKGFGSRIGEVVYESSLLHLSTFMQVLTDLNSRGFKDATIEPLIKIDFFASYGNIPTLLKINEAFNTTNRGEAKTTTIEKFCKNLPEELLQDVCNNINKKGVALKTYTIIDMPELLKKCENYIKSLELKDLNFNEKIHLQQDILGHINLVTNKKEDIKTLLIDSVVELKNQQDGSVWSYAVRGKSLGTGQNARFTVKTDVYDRKPIKVGDIIKVISVWENKSGYFYLIEYQKLK